MARLDKGGEMLAGGEPSMPVQWIDVRDLAEWAVRMAEQGKGGVFNAVGPAKKTTCVELLNQISGILSLPSRLTWVPVPWLAERGIKPFPFSASIFWGAEAGFPGSCRLSNDKARRSGLTFRPLKVTVRDTLAWYESLLPERQAQVLLPFDQQHRSLEEAMARERELLAEWHAQALPGA